MSEIAIVEAQTLLTYRHIDLFTKMKYVEFKLKGYDMRWITEVYARTIEAFSCGSYVEPGKEESKNSLQKYIDIFNELIFDIEKHGFDSNNSVIPVDPLGTIKDGAHRTAIAAYLKIQVAIKTEKETALLVDTNFFKSRLLEEKYIDYMVREYCRYTKNVFISCIWPSVGIGNEKYAIQYIGERCSIVYVKKISITMKGLKNLMIQLYDGFEWLGSPQKHFSGAWQKVQRCWSEDNPIMYVVVLEGLEKESVVKIKEKIRTKYKIENDSIHITDTQDEAIEAADLLLNKNSLNLLNFGEPDKYASIYHNIKLFRNRIRNNGLNTNDFIFDSSSVMGLYGLREPGDMDYLTLSKEWEKVEDECFNNNKHLIALHNLPLEEIINNPDCYLNCWGMKFITLDRLLIFKKNRRDNKDLRDTYLIQSALNHRKDIKSVISSCHVFFCRKARNLQYKSVNKIFDILKCIHLYEKVRFIWRKVRGNKCSK